MKFILYLSCLFILLIASLSFREGFESGQFSYLAPHPPTVLDSTTEATFITTFNASGGVVFPDAKIDPSNPKMMTDFKKYATSDEFNYYIQNKKWPYNSYIMNYVNTNKAKFLESLKQLKISSLEDLQKVLPIRASYAVFIHVNEITMSPRPLSNDIFMGTKPSPVDAAPAAKPTIHPPFSSDNYTKLQSICSTLT